MNKTLKTLCGLPGVSGHEGAVREYIESRAKPRADSLRTDRLGNLLVYREGADRNAPPLMLCAHMDEAGLIIRSATGGGYLKFVCAGSIDRRVLPGRRVFIGDKRIPGIIGMRAAHISGGDTKIPKIEDMYIDAGFNSESEANAAVELGEYAVFDGKWRDFGDGMIRAKAIDDRAGCAVLLKLMENRYQRGVWYVFTVQEEIGMRGAFGAAFAIEPAAAIAVECTTAADIPSLPPHRQVCRPGGGVVIPFMDGGTVYDRKLYQQLRAAADGLGIKWQTKEYVAGGTDAAAIQRTRGGCPVAAIAVAARYIHSPSCVVKAEECEQVTDVLREFIGGLDVV